MKKIIRIFLMAVVSAAAFIGCETMSGEKLATAIVGDWQLTEVTDMAAADMPTVYLSLTAEGGFTLYQKVGEGRTRIYTGTYTLLEGVLSGEYSDGKEWANQYNVSVDESVLTLTTVMGGEVSKYAKTTLPDLSDAVPATKSTTIL